ncbi:MAG: MBL fold metallo-hydrolase [Acidiferrobacteraceae bacterium]|jgi:ribonuclease BN (tRNA processing enzyme)
MVRRLIHLIPFLCLLALAPAEAKTGCGTDGVWLQVLGSGGPELDDGRASTGYVIWRDGKARVLVDLGGGSMDRFEQSGASVNDLDLILLSHLHVDHSADLPVLVKASFFSDRDRDLPLYGPTGNRVMPSTTEFVDGLFGAKGVYRYLNRFLTGDAAYRLVPHDVDATRQKPRVILADSRYRVSAVAVHHGPIPALAWRVEIGGKSVVFSGDMNGDYGTLAVLARNADLLVAHHAIPEGATGVARDLHMPPSVIGRVAARARVRQLVLSHRMNRTLGREPESTRWIRRDYQGPLVYADDLQCFRP